MEKPYLKIKILKKKAIIPSKRTCDSGYDFYALFEKDFVLLDPQEMIIFNTGIAAEFPENWTMIIKERGSTGTKCISVRAGIFDSNYRGEYLFPINNTGNKPVIFAKEIDGLDLEVFLEENGLEKTKVIIYPQNKAIVQGLLVYTPHVEVEVVEELSESIRGEGRLGSSGK